MQNQKIERYSPRRLSRGFTLVEILVVLSIIILLVSMLFVSVPGLLGRGRVTLAQSQVNNMHSYLTSYKTQVGSAPVDTGFGYPKTGGLFGAVRLYDAGSLFHALAEDVTLDKHPSGAPKVPTIKRFGAFDQREISLKTYNDPERGPTHWIVDPWNKPIGYIGSPERLLHKRDGGFDLFSCGPDGKTAWDGTGECANGLPYGKGSNLAYSAIGDNNADGLENNAPELGDAAFNGTLTKTKQVKLPGEVLDDINSWEQP